MKWAGQAQRQGKGQIIDHIFYWFSEDVAVRTHRERDSELRRRCRSEERSGREQSSGPRSYRRVVLFSVPLDLPGAAAAV